MAGAHRKPRGKPLAAAARATHGPGGHQRETGERLEQTPGQLTEHTPSAPRAGEHLLDELAGNAHRHQDTTVG